MKKSLSIKDFSVHIRECKNKKVFKKLKAMFLYLISNKPAKEVASIVYHHQATFINGPTNIKNMELTVSCLKKWEAADEKK